MSKLLVVEKFDGSVIVNCETGLLTIAKYNDKERIYEAFYAQEVYNRYSLKINTYLHFETFVKLSVLGTGIEATGYKLQNGYFSSEIDGLHYYGEIVLLKNEHKQNLVDAGESGQEPIKRG